MATALHAVTPSVVDAKGTLHKPWWQTDEDPVVCAYRALVGAATIAGFGKFAEGFPTPN
jgi:hypothetical protein